MLEIRKIDITDKKIINSIVAIHLATFEGFFLTFMGKGFLHQMYTSYIEHSKSSVFIALENDVVLGFLAYSEDLSALYKYMISHRLIQFAWYSLGAFFRKPTVFMRLVRAFLKPTQALRVEKYIELSSIGVSIDAKSRGVGSSLINVLKAEVDFNEFEYITLETDAVNNTAANNFYIKNGFTAVRDFETYEGRKMREYRFSGRAGIECAEDFIHT